MTQRPLRGPFLEEATLFFFLLYIFPFNCVKIYPETNDPKKKLAETETVSQQLPGLMRCSEMLLTP